jgi:hypothetical protein
VFYEIVFVITPHAGIKITKFSLTCYLSETQTCPSQQMENQVIGLFFIISVDVTNISYSIEEIIQNLNILEHMPKAGTNFINLKLRFRNQNAFLKPRS